MIAGATPGAVLLDTCAVIWLVNGVSLSAAARDAIANCTLLDTVYVSTTTALEIGLLSRPRANQSTLPMFLPDPKAWFATLLTKPGIRETPILATIAIDASHLPGNFHPDLMDRLIVSTARHLRIPIVTSDRKILAYAAAGHVQAIPC